MPKHNIWVPGDPVPGDMKSFKFFSWITDTIAVTLYVAAQDLQVLMIEKVDSIISLGELSPQETAGRPVTRFQDFWDGTLDVSDETISGAVAAVLEQSEEGRTLVHCAAGVSRSPGLVMLSLAIRNGWTWERSKEYVTEKRPTSLVHELLERRLCSWLDANRSEPSSMGEP